MISKLVIYQKNSNFVFTREKERKEIDAEEFLRNLDAAREQLSEHKKAIVEFERDIQIMEKLEPIAQKIRDDEINKGREERRMLK